jgi:hypothetical protein
MLPHTAADNSDHRSAHRTKMAAKKALRADPVAHAAKLEAINAESIQNRRL